LLAEGASQKPLNGIRTRGSQGPDDSQGHVDHMEHLGGAFKLNSVRLVRAVKETGQQITLRRLSEVQTTKISARNLAKLRLLHKN
jgi:hypothetical protein